MSLIKGEEGCGGVETRFVMEACSFLGGEEPVYIYIIYIYVMVPRFYTCVCVWEGGGGGGVGPFPPPPSHPSLLPCTMNPA